MAYSLYKIILLLVSSSVAVVVAFDGKKLSTICSGNLFPFDSEYEYAMHDTLNDLILHTSEARVMDYYCQDTHLAESLFGRDVTLYGHGVCTSSLSQPDCKECLNYANSEMLKECTHSEGAQIQLMDCRIRYENYKFNNDG